MREQSPLAAVLVVDDEEPLRKFLECVLETSGYTVVVADCGETAIEITRLVRFHVVILDMIMPGLSGQQTLPELLKLQPDLKVIISSGYLEDQQAMASMAPLVASFLRKPYSHNELLTEVARALGEPRADQENSAAQCA